ncbi:MAG: prepilin-type N-terminal cleavage/methylation domain-containing protein [Candidatus Omnitrophica bacterium]|nr:prepilin-type N-terminal cleavage/methylation domain-containing protein [Candidatus Omnitrophota bacterium]
MNKLVKNNKGFTLMEVLIVVIVLGVLAGLAVPIFTKTTDKAVKAEALTTLTAIRGSMMRHFIENGSYSGASDNDDSGRENVSFTDFDWSDAAQIETGQEVKFQYKVITSGPVGANDQWLATATLKTGDTDDIVTIRTDGCVSGTGKFLATPCA